MLLLPVFDGQTMGAAAVDPEAIHMIRPAVMPGTCNIFIHGDQTVNALGVYMDMATLLQKLEESGFNFIDLGGKKNVSLKVEQNGGGH